MQVLLLNASEEPISVIPWQKAVVLLCRGRAIKPYGHDDCYQIPTSSGDFELPNALVLSEYKYIPTRRLAVTRKNVFKRDKYLCQYCGDKVDFGTATIDHVIPQSKGGKDTWQNLVTSCRCCNSAKGDRTPKQAEMTLQKEPVEPKRTSIMYNFVSETVLSSWKRWLP